MININAYRQIISELNPAKVKLVAVSKKQPTENVLELYQQGQRVFGENFAQNLKQRTLELPADIEWHMIGHLQSNKIKYIAPFVSLIHSVDSLKLLQAINSEAIKYKRTIDCLLQIFIASEETKFGLDESEVKILLQNPELSALENIRIRGLMGMATFTDDENRIGREFRSLKSLFDNLKSNYIKNPGIFDTLSMGMSDDYKIAVAEGSNMVRIGTLLFGARNYDL